MQQKLMALERPPQLGREERVWGSIKSSLSVASNVIPHSRLANLGHTQSLDTTLIDERLGGADLGVSSGYWL